MNITGNVSTEVITTMVEVLKDTSTLVTAAPPGIAYKNANVWIGTKGFAIPRNIQKGFITFRVETSWINSNNLASSDIKLQRWDGTGWVPLETIQKSEDGKYTYFEAVTNAFSPFSITGIKGEAPPVQTKEAMSASTPAGTPVETKSTTYRVPSIGVIFVIGIFIALYLMKKGKSK